jgi:class 3 adenylate cyclase/tetratricopeptide (TPR) repeat protein
VLFADATGSTALTERIGDEEAYRLVQACAARMSDAVERHGGTVTQFRGDGIMALFGAPLAYEDSAVRAVLAALDMQQLLQAYAAEVEDRLGVTCRFRVGLNTGPVVVGRIGDDVLLDYTAIGDTANVAARMEQAAPPGGVLIAEGTWRAVRDFVECEPKGPLEVRGKSAPVEAFEALRPTGVRSRWDAALARGLSPFVGRSDELALLDGFVRRLSGRQGRAVLVTGEAGIGKSRLLLELRERVPAGVDWFEGHCSAADQHTHLLPIAHLLRGAFGVEESDDAEAVAARVDAASTAWSETARTAVPYLKWVLRAGGEELDELDPRERRAGVLEALRTTMVDAAERRPLVLLIEDLHWADESSDAAVAALADAVADQPVLLVVTSRPGHPSALDHNPAVVRLALDQLGDDHTGTLVAGLLGGAALPDDLRSLIWARSEGNPLFVEEVTAALVETGALRQDGAGYRLAVDPGGLAIPDTLQDVILARIDRLDRSAREALQLASVIGREFTRRLLDRIAELPGELDDDLRQLQVLELIRQKSYFPELAFLFKHALTHDVTYSTLLGERRQVLHRVVAEAIEELYPGRLAEHCETLARHWLAAGEPRRALTHLELSGDRAMQGFSVATAVTAYEQASAIAEDAGDLTRAASLVDRGAMALLSVADLAGAIEAFDREAAIARRIPDPDREAAALGHRGHMELLAHRYDTAESTLREAISTTDPAVRDGRVVAGFALRTLLEVLDRHDEIPQVEAIVEPLLADSGPRTRSGWEGVTALHDNWCGRWSGLDELVAKLRSIDDLAWKQTGGWIAGLAAAGRGDYDLAIELLRSVIDLGERAGEVLGRARSLNSLGWIHGDLQDHQGALVWNRRCLDFIAPLGVPDAEIEANARLNLADTWMTLGDLDQARGELAWVQAVVEDPTSDPWMMWRYRQHLQHSAGELCLRDGDPDGALALAAACLEAATRTDSPRYVVKALRLRGQALAALDLFDEAAGVLDRAVDEARRLGNPPQLWRTLAAASRVCAQRSDDRSRALARDARQVVDDVAGRLSDEALRGALLGSAEVVAIDALT